MDKTNLTPDEVNMMHSLAIFSAHVAKEQVESLPEEDNTHDELKHRKTLLGHQADANFFVTKFEQ